MAELSKQALIVDNNQSFPNNNAGAITPDVLRSYNRDVIDSTVNQSVYTADSASFLTLIDNTDTNIGNLIATASVNVNVITFTKDNGSTFNLSVTASIPTLPWDNITDKPTGLVSGSSQVVSILTPLNAFSASQITKDSTLATYTGSVTTQLTNLSTSQSIDNTKWSNLGSQSGSFVTESETGSFARTNVSNTFTANQNITGDLNVTGTINANKLNVIIESSSVIFSSGSNILGDSATADTQTLNGIVKVSGSQQITGSLTQTGSANTLWGQTTINNNTTIGNGGILNVGGQIQAQSGIYTLNGNGVTVAANTNNSGSAYSNINMFVDTTTDPTNVYSAIGLTDDKGNGNFSLSMNSYAYQYPGVTLPTLIGFYQNQDGSDLAIAFPSNGTAEHWKKSNFKYGVDVTGSINQRNGANTINGLTTINNNTTIGNNGTLSVAGAITASSGIVVLNGSGIDLKSNVEGSGSSFTSVTSTIDVTSDPTNVYSSYQLIKPGGETLIAIAANSYTAEYPNTTIPYLFGGGNNPGGTNAGIAFPTNGQMDVWKKSNFKYGVAVTGSVNGNVATQAITSNTASFDFSTANFFELNLTGGASTRIQATNVKPGQTVNVKVTQASPTTGSVTFSNQFDFPQFSGYTASLQAGAVDILTFITFNDTSSIYSAAIKNLS